MISVASYKKNLKSILGRVVTQVCRDPNSSSYGCFDRNWWHYKISDFPSSILQQGGYTLFLASEELDGLTKKEKFFLKTLSVASVSFWHQRAIRYGAFEEYYPFEAGYPPLAFSALSVAKTIKLANLQVADYDLGLRVAVKQLQSRFETQALNQQIAGLAALSVIKSIDSKLVNITQFDLILNKTLSFQSKEGWFPEYDGPDAGYLSVSIDCLWDIYDHTSDSRCLNAIDKAIAFLAWFYADSAIVSGMLNSRNTDYIVPYGIVRALYQSTNSVAKRNASIVIKKIFDRDQYALGYLDRVDDRYLCHYIGHSYIRSFRLLKIIFPQVNKVLKNEVKRNNSHEYLEDSRFLKKIKLNYGALIAISKGGSLSAWSRDRQSYFSDFGWVVHRGSSQYVSNWWSLDWNVKFSSTTLDIKGSMFKHTSRLPSPILHISLRVLSVILTKHLAVILKSIFIYKRKANDIRLLRNISFDNNSISIEDKFYGLKFSDVLVRSPRSSKRHVSSADVFNSEDVTLSHNMTIESKEFAHSKHLKCQTVITKYFFR